MSLTTILFIAVIGWMLVMRLRPGGHGGCGSHAGHRAPREGGDHGGVG